MRSAMNRLRPVRNVMMQRDSDITRRVLLRNAAVGSAALAAGLGSAGAQSTSKPPNIIFILADDLGYADVSCYGRRDFVTPNIDRIAARGVRFLQGYANSAVCSATRVALITGRYQYRLPIGLEEPLVRADLGLPLGHPTLPSLLKKVDYGTCLIGKWHLGLQEHISPLKSGYDRFFGFRGGVVDYFTHLGVRGAHDLWDGDVEVNKVGYVTELLGARAVDEINSYAKSGRPFLISLHFNAPHWPWEAPGDEAEAKRMVGKDPRHYDGGTQKTYQRMIESMDGQIGRVLDAVEANGLTENTIVIFTSDNGGERFSDTWPFSGKKTELLEGGLRIPMIVAWPARIVPGRTSDQVAMTMDWLPTLLAAAGAAPDPAFPSDGMNLLPWLSGNAAAVDRTLFWRYKANWQRAARVGDYKFLKILDNTFLFNVVEDPLERANLKERHKDIYDRVVAAWQAWNATMLPEIAESFTEAYTGGQLADHIGARKASGAPEPVDPLPPAQAR